MNRITIRAAAAALALCMAAPSIAALPVGTTAPDFSTQASLAGKPFAFHLADALKKGPVVLYFYPAAFTSGCTFEAHDFAAATDAFARLGATVIGVSGDSIDTLNRFSVTECRNRFGRRRRRQADLGLSGQAADPVALQPHLVRDRAQRPDHLRI